MAMVKRQYKKTAQICLNAALQFFRQEIKDRVNKVQDCLNFNKRREYLVLCTLSMIN